MVHSNEHPNRGRLNAYRRIVVGRRRCWRDFGNGHASCLGPGNGTSSSPALSVFAPNSCRPLMTMALDVAACLGLATDDAKPMNFAELCCLVTGSVIAGAPRAIRKGRRLSKMLDELGGRIRPCTHEHAHPSRRCSGFLCEHLRWSWHLRDFAPQSFDTEVSNFAPSGRSGVGGTQSSQLPLLE